MHRGLQLSALIGLLPADEREAEPRAEQVVAEAQAQERAVAAQQLVHDPAHDRHFRQTLRSRIARAGTDHDEVESPRIEHIVISTNRYRHSTRPHLVFPHPREIIAASDDQRAWSVTSRDDWCVVMVVTGQPERSEISDPSGERRTDGRIASEVGGAGAWPNPARCLAVVAREGAEQPGDLRTC